MDRAVESGIQLGVDTGRTGNDRVKVTVVSFIQGFEK
jgi:hypothetical protein